VLSGSITRARAKRIKDVFNKRIQDVFNKRIRDIWTEQALRIPFKMTSIMVLKFKRGSILDQYDPRKR
jgi:hypothetical protein